MKQIALVILLAIPIMAKGDWDVGGKVAVVDINGSPKLKVVGTSEYRIGPPLSWRTDIELIMDELNPAEGVDLAVPSNLLWYPLPKSKIEPYLGPGVVFTYVQSGKAWFGLNGLAGIQFPLTKKKKIGIEAKYTVSDMFNWSSTDNFDLGVKGNLELDF